VYSRNTFGTTLTLAASGWTYENTFVLYDQETESLWYHLQGQDGLTCIAGEYADRGLSEFTSTQTRWANWLTDHPNSQYLKRP
jgi:Protein of unknown function (DUF3179)